MKIHSIIIRNYRPFKILEETRLGDLTTLIGKNDAGKSSILRAIELFFQDKPKIEDDDIHDHAATAEDVIVEIAFTSLPETIEIEEGIETTFKDEMLLDQNGNLRIRKIYPRDNLTKAKFSLITWDFQDETFAGLANLKETELNRRCSEENIEVTRAGRGITNKAKREDLRAKAKQDRIILGQYELILSPRDSLLKFVKSILPEFQLFESETTTDISATSFQSPFRPIIKSAAEQKTVTEARIAFTRVIEDVLQKEVDRIFEKLQRHTSDIKSLRVEPIFSWDKAVNFQIYGADHSGIEKSLEKRGSGLRRLLMVAFFQYLAEKQGKETAKYIFGIEEPENSLHPGLQRELIDSFKQLAEMDSQIIVTSHSPVFAGASPIEDLTLIIREDCVANSIQCPDLDLSIVAEELGVEPSDQITGYDACVFVEGIKDIKFFAEIASKLKDAGYIQTDFNEKNIGFISVGGSNLKYWITSRAMRKLNKRFGVVVDSDRKNSTDNVPQRKLNWKKQCEEEGGTFFILRKREIENYLHPEAIQRSGRDFQQYDDFTDMKKLFGKNVYKVIEDMTSDEILELDIYDENGNDHHELKEIVEKLINLI